MCLPPLQHLDTEPLGPVIDLSLDAPNLELRVDADVAVTQDDEGYDDGE